jgi:glycine/D-amino acid oxidase-like deaminating enzyme
VVIDHEHKGSASVAAAGIMNPVTGRRYAITWKADEVIPFACKVYEEMGTYLDTTFVHEKSIIDFFPSPQMRNSFIDRLTDNDTYLHAFPEQNQFNPFFNYDFGCGEISPAFTVHLSLLLACWRKKLMDLNCLIDETFEHHALRAEPHQVQYGNITAEKIIFCEGASADNNTWFNKLPFAFNKGEALVIECDTLLNQHLYKKSIILAPLPVVHTYWVGSNFLWDFEDDQPTQTFYDQTTSILNHWLKVPYKVLFHKAAVRPATVERRPFVGFHPAFPSVGILNGMGTKGTSLAPFFAHELVQHLAHGVPLTDESNVNRFSRILSR